MQVNMLETKSQLSKLVKAALEGEEVIIASHGVPMVKLVKVGATRKARKPGRGAGCRPRRRIGMPRSSTGRSRRSLPADTAHDALSPRYPPHLLVDDQRLGKAARTLIAEADCAVSVASIWEMLLKNAKGKLPLPKGPIQESLEGQNFRVLPIHARHVEATRQLAHLHDDPFDRLLAATAASEQMVFLTRDEQIQKSGLSYVRSI
jgi:prevent-host-death family protein